MTDKIYKKQLEKFGTDATVFVEGDLAQRRKLDFTEANLGIVKSLMDTVEGRQWLHSKLDLYGVFTAPFAGEKPVTNAYFAGVQAAGQDLLDDIMKSAPNHFFTMVQEAAARQANKS